MESIMSSVRFFICYVTGSAVKVRMKTCSMWWSGNQVNASVECIGHCSRIWCLIR